MSDGRATLDGEPTEGGGAGRSLGPYERVELQRGDAVGRYLVLSVLGAGGMGVVYEAHDPGLDRSVALKVLAPDRGAGALNEAGRQEIRREAQALAKLAHRNVVTVHDVGEFNDGVFVAMEHIRGVTLREWVEQTTPTAAEVLAVFVEAGQGLIAAHDVGIVHHDFKPANVMVSEDGRVTVLDFGLARNVEQRLHTQERALGTPAYMAPERHRSRQSDPRGDQFSYCVALYEMLFGRRPFRGDTPDAIAISVLRGKLETPPPTRQVSRRVVRAILRGLSRDPSQRWPSMHELVEVLKPPAGLVRRATLVASAMLVGAAVTWAAVATDSGRCDDASAVVTDLWTPEHARSFVQAAREHGVEGELPRTAAASMTSQAAALSTELVEACKVGGDATPRALCLRERTVAFSSMASVMSELDPDVIGMSDAVAEALVPPEACRSAAADRQYTDAVGDDDAATALKALARGRALSELGRTDAAREQLQAVLEHPRREHWPGIWANALVVLATIETADGQGADAEARLEQAFGLAVEVGSRRLIARVLQRLAESRLGRGQIEEVLSLEPLLRATSTEPAVVDATLASAYMMTGRYGEAETMYRQVLEAGGPPAFIEPQRANLAAVALLRGEYLSSLELGRDVLDNETRLFGARSPRTIAAKSNVANALVALGRAEEAVQTCDESLEELPVSGVPSSDQIGLRLIRAVALGQLGAVDQAGSEVAATLVFAREGLSETYVVLSILSTASDTTFWAGDVEASLQHADEVIALIVKTMGEDTGFTALPHGQRARALAALGRPAEARRSFEQALRELEAFNPQHPARVLMLRSLATLEVEGGRLAEASTLADRAFAAARGGSVHPIERGNAAVVLATVRALQDPADASISTLREDAEGAFAQLPQHPEALRADLEKLADPVAFHDSRTIRRGPAND